jgi:hypothetical protein
MCPQIAQEFAWKTKQNLLMSGSNISNLTVLPLSIH